MFSDVDMFRFTKSSQTGFKVHIQNNGHTL